VLQLLTLPILSLGRTGPYVALLQLALDRAGFSLKKDGFFGPATLAALRAFQTANSLTADGIAGRYTWRALTPWLLGYAEHTVKSGETLYRLSLMYGTTLRAIEIANPDADALALPVGARLVIPFAFPVVPADVSFTPTLLAFCVAGLKARYPFLETGSVGASVMNRPLHYLRIGVGSTEVFYNAAHHANEWITAPLLMRFLENYARAYAMGASLSGESASRLYASTALYVMPMVDPDGVSLVTGELDSGPYFEQAAAIAADYPAIPFPEGWKANIAGVDLNLQYPAGWDNAKAIKFAQGFTSPAPRDFVGVSPLAAPESRAVYDFTRYHDFALTISYHTQGRVIYWRYLDAMPEGAYEIALKFSAASGYAVENVPAGSAYAGYKDWFIAAFDRPGFTIEAGYGTAPLPLSQFSEIYAANEGILVIGLTAGGS